MSSINKGAKLLLKRIECRFSPYGPDHYIFQSEGMRDTAVLGRGIPRNRTSVVRSGVDAERFKPSPRPNWYVHDAFGIDRSRKIVYYSGHMERRKGVHVIVAAAAHIINNLHRKDLHFLFLGNREGEEAVFDPLYRGTEAEGHITFGGYRDDVAALQSASYLAVIATTGWDSHTMTAVEGAASGLPLVVSDVPGLREAVAEGTGFLFPAEDHLALAERICTLANDERLRQQMGAMARERVLKGYTREHQIAGLEAVVRQVAGPILQG
jgi:glycosyltransferase involved in cell wall biosynthesis